MKQWIAIGLLMAAPAVAAAPDDVDLNGTWALSGEVSGVQVIETCTLTQKETSITGSCDTSTGKYDTTGKIDGKTIVFKHGGKYEGTELTITYTGKYGTDGALNGTMDVDPFNVTGSFSAKKNGAAPAQ